MIFLPHLNISFNSFDDLLTWYCSDHPFSDETISIDAKTFIVTNFPLVDNDAFWVSYKTVNESPPFYGSELGVITYNKTELIRTYPEYFI